MLLQDIVHLSSTEIKLTMEGEGQEKSEIILFIYLFIIYLMMVSVDQTIKVR
jgi:hypothetical protein